MKEYVNRIVISKYHQSVQLAHLYEHLYVDALKVFLADEGFYPLLDYDLGGSTVDGKIVVEFEYWNEAIVSLIPTISFLPIPQRLKNIVSCIDQIETEKNATLRYNSIASIRAGLSMLIEQQWLDLNEHKLLPIRTGMKSVLRFDKTHPPKTSQLVLEIELDRTYAKRHLELLPLYRRVSMVLGLHLENVLEQRYGAYGLYESYDGKKNGRHYMRVALLLPRNTATSLRLDDVASLLAQATFEMHYKNGLNRMADQMAHLSYKTDLIVPDIWETARTTGQILSAEEWHKLSTHENVQRMVDRAHFRIKIGKRVGNYSLNEFA